MHLALKVPTPLEQCNFIVAEILLRKLKSFSRATKENQDELFSEKLIRKQQQRVHSARNQCLEIR
jgi:hypothetical protein